MECLAIIPARGGSKGIPRKNVLPLAGKPLLAYNIEQARQSRWITRVVVSTDDAEIAAVSQQYGAEVVWRPAEISGDRASSELALLHTLDYLQQHEGYSPELLVFLQCTSPLTAAEDMDGTVEAVLESGADTGLAVIPFHYFLWKETADESGQVDAVGINHQKGYRPLRQEREPQFLETGAVYVMRVSGFIQARHRFFGRSVMYVMPAERRLEIDDPVDFQVAEVLLRDQEKTKKMAALPERVSALVLDFDGVFTDNRVVVFQDGREAVVCDRGDGWGIGQLKKTGLPILILSTETNPVVEARANKLKLPCIQGLGGNKWEALQGWLAEHEIDPAEILYVGNDANDLECMQHAGYVAVVADAHPSVLHEADLILDHPGGQGAIREICDLLLEKLLR